MKSQRTTLAGIVIDRIIDHSTLLNVLLVIGGSLLIAISAQVAIPVPFSPVPMTLQPLALVLVGACLGSLRGSAAASLYLLEGLSGLPVFAQGHAGVLALVGPTAGYLYAYPAATWVAGFFSERGWNRSFLTTAAAMIAALGVIYLGGWSWLAGPMGMGASRAFTIGVAPFVLADLVKVGIALVLLPAAQRSIDRRH